MKEELLPNETRASSHELVLLSVAATSASSATAAAEPLRLSLSFLASHEIPPPPLSSHLLPWSSSCNHLKFQSFYSPEFAMSTGTDSAKHASLGDINSNSFDPDHYMNLMVHKSNLEGLLQRHVKLAAEIKNLDTDLQMLVYENYNKFISATDTINRMKSNISRMETNMEQHLEKIMSVQSRSDSVNTSLFDKREHIEKLHPTCNLLRKVQFIYDLSDRLNKCIKSEAYADAVRFYTGGMPILMAYGDSSFQD
ncbi:hypothetical protein Ahy_A04g018937 [Arachis hypogaea]|uniref:Vacuolar protein sorting-associated protein 51 homolog n=2 Tax=Arachis hypogaea TaxID=3818 RepID=A0A445DF30_ARAHY|nr:hypothetical protein Ahy_A04g018937 [Arachis hypogaea]